MSFKATFFKHHKGQLQYISFMSFVQFNYLMQTETRKMITIPAHLQSLILWRPVKLL